MALDISKYKRPPLDSNKYKLSQKTSSGSIFSDFANRVNTDLTTRGQDFAHSIIDAPQRAKDIGIFPALGEAGLRAAGSAAGGIFDVPADIFKSIAPQRLKNAIRAGAGAVGNQIIKAPGISQAADFLSSHPNISKDVGAAVDIAGAALGAEGWPLAAKGAGKAVQASGDVIAGTGRATEGIGRILFRRAITPNAAEAEKILGYEAKVPFLKRVANTITGKESALKPTLRGDTALEKGIFGTQKMVGVQAKRGANKLWDSVIAPAVKNSKAIVTKDELFAPVEERIASTLEPTKRAAYREAYRAIKADYANVTHYSLEDAQSIKRSLDEFTPEKIFRGKNVAYEYRTLANDMANAIRSKTYSVLENDKIRKAYLDYGNLSELEKVGVKAITEAGTKGGFGNFWTSMWDMATTPVKTIGGQTLYRVGNMVEFVGKKGIKRFGQFLQGKGFERPVQSAILTIPKITNYAEGQ